MSPLGVSPMSDPLVPFGLEDFFDEYEHRAEFINLASSDALPWTSTDLHNKGISLAEDADFTLRYPDARQRLLPGLERLSKPPAGIVLLPTAGAAEAIALAMHEFSASSLGGNRTVGIPRPAYGGFHGLAALLGLPIEKYEYHPSRDWTPSSTELLELSGRCGALIVTNPHNPTGQVMSLDMLAHLKDKLSSHGGILIVDEVFNVAGEAESAMALGPDVVVIGSMSKTYGLPGLRLGWLAIDQGRLVRMRTIQQYLTLSLSAMTVALGSAILETPGQFSREELILDNRQLLHDWADAHCGVVSISAPQGGTTVCLKVDTAVDETDLFGRFLKQGVLLAPGTRCFECRYDVPWFRLGYGAQSQALQQGLERVSTVVNGLPSH
jgi:aspartate/methionine/tyrosine aminotransferase